MTGSPARPLARPVLAATGLALLASALLPLAIDDGDLPEPLATRWSVDGEVISTMSHTALAVMAAVMLVPCAVVLLAAAVTRREARAGSRTMWAGAVAMFGATVAVAVVMVVAANRGHTAAEQVPGPAVWQIVLLLVVTLAAGALAAWAASGLPEAPSVAASTAPLAVPDTAVVAWSRTLTVRWGVALAAVLGVAGLLLVVLTDQTEAGVVVLVSGLPALLLSHIEVFADRRGLTVTYGPGRWPRTRIPLDRIRTAAPIDLKPAEWGGWGYRGSVKLFRRAAVVLRAGPGLRLELTDGRRFAVSIDDPETAAAVLTREILRA